MSRSRRRRGQRGAALMEMAFALPVLTVMGLGMADMTRAYSLQVSLRNAAREGGGFAQYHPSASNSTCDPNAGISGVPLDNLDITSKALSSDASLTGLTVTLQHGIYSTGTFQSYTSVCGETFAAGDTVQVSVSKTFTPISPIGQLVVGSSKMLTGVSTVQVIVQ